MPTKQKNSVIEVAIMPPITSALKGILVSMSANSAIVDEADYYQYLEDKFLENSHFGDLKS